jgi:hypothetical protein
MAEPFCTFGALRPWLRLLRSPTSMTSVPPLVMLLPILPISSRDRLIAPGDPFVAVGVAYIVEFMGAEQRLGARFSTFAVVVSPTMLRLPPAAMLP